MDWVMLVISMLFVAGSLAYTESVERRREKRWNQILKRWIDDPDGHG